MFKKIAILALTGILLATSAVGARAYDPWVIPDAKQGEMRLSIGEGLGFGASMLQALKVSPAGVPLDERLCASIGTGVCKAKTGWIVRGDVLLGVCVENEVNCIESVSVYKEGEEPAAATFVRNAPGITTPANLKADVPRGSTVSVWRAESQPNSAGETTYAAAATVSFHVFGPKAGFEIFTATVVPVKETLDPKVKDIQVIQQDKNGKSRIGVSNYRERCVYQSAGECATRQNFEPNTRVSMTLRMTNSLTGWLKGRLQDPVIDISQFKKGYNRITVDATPVDLPMLSASLTKGNFPTAMKSSRLFGDAWRQLQDMPSQYAAGQTWYSDTSDGLALVEGVRNVVKDKATGLQSTWSFSSIFRPDNSANKCLTDKSKVLGLVTTNAMAYEGGPPAFKSGFLQYQLAGMHYLPDGKTQVRGTYDLVMRSSVARCLYKFTNAPVSATITVTGGRSKEVATTTVGESNGWLKLSANNFTFSKKVIKIKLKGTKK